MVARLVLMLGALLGLGVWLGGLLGVLIPQEREQIRTAQTHVVLDRLVSVVNAQNEQLERLASAAANRPGLADRLERGLSDVQRLALEADFTALLPGGLTTRLFRLNEAQLEPNAALPITFATLDLIRRVEAGELPPAESFTVSSRRMIRLARPIRNDRGIVGTLMIVIDQNPIFKHIAGASDLGQVDLIQRFDGAQPQQIFSVGQGQGQVLSRPTRHPYWTLEMRPNPTLGAHLGINLVWALGVAAVALILSVIAGLVGLELLRRGHHQRLAQLTQYVLASHREPGLAAPDFGDPAYEKAARALSYKTQKRSEPSETQAAAVTSSAAIASGAEHHKPAAKPKPPQEQLSTPAPPPMDAEPLTAPATEIIEEIELAPVEMESQSTAVTDPDPLPAMTLTLEPEPEPEPSKTAIDFSALSLVDAEVDLEAGEESSRIDVDLPRANPPSQQDARVILPMGYQPDPSIFRAYDVRGETTDTLTPQVAFALGKVLASEAASQGQSKVVTGGDGRLSTPELKDALNNGILSAGLDVIDIGIVPTPLVYYACAVSETQTGVMVTGSHNPKDYNGFKMMIAGNTLAGAEIQALLKRIQDRYWIEGQGTLENRDYVEPYLAEVSQRIGLKPGAKIVIDCGNGVTGMMATRFFETLGCDVDSLYTDVDGNFPNHHPDPSKPANVVELQARVKALGADIGFAFDGDGDRVGVITAGGENVFADRLMMLLGRDVAQRNPGEAILYDVKCSRHLGRIIREAGGNPVMCQTGHSLVKRQMKALNAPLGGEMSGHIFFTENWHGFDDALYTAARVLEMTDRLERSMDDLLAELPSDVSTPEINLNVTDQTKFSIVQRLSDQGWFEGGELSDIDGVRVDYPDGFGLVRASNTTPVLVLRFEAANETALERIKQQFRSQLTLVAPDLNLEF